MIKSENKEYLLEFSKIDIKQKLDFHREKDKLIELKRTYDIYRDSNFFLKYFKRQTYKIDIYMDEKYNFIISPENIKDNDIQYCFSLKYKLTKENVMYKFLIEQITLECLLEILEKRVQERFIEIKANLFQDLLVKNVLHWCQNFNKYPFLIYIINVEDFYNFIGKYDLFDHMREDYYTVKYSKIIELLKYRIGYSHNEINDSVAFLNIRNKDKDLYAKLIYNQYYNEEFEDFDYKIGSFLIYSIYNNLIPSEKIDDILRIKSNFLFKFLVESFYTKEEVLNKILSYVSKDNPFEYRCNVKGIQNLTLIPQIIYNIEIDKGYFRENGSEILLEITKSLILGNKIKIGTNLVRYHLEKEVLLKHLLENINVLLKVFNITREEFERVISENLL